MRLKLKELFLRLVRLNSNPRGIAFGVSIGVFIGITPLYGFHTLMVILAALLVPRTNKIAILVGTNISIPPTLPFITWGGYEIGRLILPKEYPPLNWHFFSKITLQNIAELYLPLFVGSIILGLILSVIFFIISLEVVTRYKARHSSNRQ
ncbi:MAG TPA: DUF2062 domain-containing protein [Candidatus Omnitrophota bacterium]|nr:DUF2062 domain-containing protein [Candidatus Omnitrophota bacterium]